MVNILRSLLKKDISKILNPTYLSNRLKHMKGIQPSDNFIKTLTSIHQSYLAGDSLKKYYLITFQIIYILELEPVYLIAK